MKLLRKLFTAVILPLVCMHVINVSAAPEVVPENVLDTLEVVSPISALEAFVDDPDRTTDVETLFTSSSSNFVSCVRVPAGDLLCLDDSTKKVMAWDGDSLAELFSCGDAALALRKPQLCTAHTFGLGVNFVAGVNKGKSYSLYAYIDPVSGVAEELYTGRPLLLEIKPVENEAADDFPFGEGVIGIEQRSDAVFFRVPAIPGSDPIVLVDKRGWGIRGKVTVDSVDIWQINNPVTSSVDNYVIATMSDGWVRAMEINGSGNVIELFDIVAKRTAQSDPFVASVCSPDEQHYGIEISERTGYGYLSDRNHCQVVTLKPHLDANGKLDYLDYVQETDSSGDTSNLIISTANVMGTSYPVVGATVSEGIGIDLFEDGCTTATGCTFISGAQGVDAATLQEVTLANNSGTDVRAYQLKGLLHCAYIAEECIDLVDPGYVYIGGDPAGTPNRAEAIARLVQLGILYELPGASGNLRPEEFVFNVTPTLPEVIWNQIPMDASTPDGRRALWLLPDWQAQGELDFRFEGLFFATDARTRDVLTLELNVAALQGFADQGCETADDLGPDFDLATDGGIDRLLMLDITTRVSERDPWINGPQSSVGNNHQDTNAYEDCGSTRNRGGGVSFWSYNLKIAGCQGVYDANGDLVFEGLCYPYDVQDLNSVAPDDAALAKVYVKRYNELRLHLDQLACTLDSSGTQPISDTFCTELRAIHDNGWDKLNKALVAAIDDKNSAPKENFGAVASQLDNYHAKVLEATASGTGGDDPANRRGEQAALAETLISWLEDKVIPSAQDGFVETDTKWIEIPVFPAP